MTTAELINRICGAVEAAERRFLAVHTPPELTAGDRAQKAFNRLITASIGQAIQPLTISADQDTLKGVFDLMYIPYVTRYGITPSLLSFSSYVNLTIPTLNRFPQLIDYINLYIKEYLIDELQDSSGTNVNRIFVLKAIHGLSDQPKVNITSQHNTKAMATRADIVAELGGSVDIKGLPIRDKTAESVGTQGNNGD